MRPVLETILRQDFRYLATQALAGLAPFHYLDFISNKAILAGRTVGPISSIPNFSMVRNSVGYAQRNDGTLVIFPAHAPRMTDRGVLIEGARTNLFLNSDIGVTQVVTVAAADHTLSFYGTGTITLLGASTAGPLVGTGANNRVALTFTPIAGALTLTVSGSCTNVNLEAGAFASSFILTAGASATRAADVATVTTPGVTYPLTLFAEFERAVDTAGEESIFTLSDGTTAEQARLRVDPSDLGSSSMTAGAVAQATPSVAGSLAVGTVYRSSARFATNDTQIARSATLGVADTSCTLPATPTTIHLGTRVAAAGPTFGYLRRAAVFDRALSDAELVRITT